MILYQLAKRLAERNRLQDNIERSEGNIEALVTQKEQVEEQLLTQANMWKEEGQDEFMLAALAPEPDSLPVNESLY